MSEHDHPINEPSFRLDDFKKWMESQKAPSLSRKPRIDEMQGAHVYPRLTSKRLLNKMVAEDGDVSDMARDFRKNGGQVVRIDEAILIVDVSSGTFAIPRYLVTRVS